jgi:thioredoxin-related protein
MEVMLRSVLLTALAATAALAAAGDGWHTDYKKAAAESKRTGKPLLVDFTGSDWCGWCMKLDREVFSKPEFKSWAKKNVVLLKLDFPQTKKLSAAETKQNEGLAQKYKVRGFPTVLFLKHDGKKLGEYGYDEGGPGIWTKRAKQVIAGKSATTF